jgi:hypothetical protein
MGLRLCPLDGYIYLDALVRVTSRAVDPTRINQLTVVWSPLSPSDRTLRRT